MRLARIEQLEQCVSLAKELRSQLQENETSFGRCVSSNINDVYREAIHEANEEITKLLRLLSQLQAAEQAKLFAELQA